VTFLSWTSLFSEKVSVKYMENVNAVRYKIMTHTCNLYVFTFLTITEIVIRNLSETSQIAQ